MKQLTHPKTFLFQDIGINIYTVSEAINEVKDKATRDRLQVLPKDLTVREPTPDSLKIGKLIFICPV